MRGAMLSTRKERSIAADAVEVVAHDSHGLRTKALATSGKSSTSSSRDA
jgi:hypothetical protein